MKKKQIITGALVLAVIAAAGMASQVMAAGNTNSGLMAGKIFSRGIGKGHGQKPATPLTAAQKADMQAKQKAVKTALDAGDYGAWAAAVKALNANSPILTKITADNFSQYVQANKLQEQADSILKALGVDNREPGGHMPGGSI